jgi:hypothetical protein
MPSRFHEGALRSRLQDRKAARRRRGLDGRQRRRDQNSDRSPPAFMCRIVVKISDRLASAALVRGGMEVKDTGLLVVLRVALCGPVWSLLGVLVFELVALVRRITVVTNAKAPVAIGGHEPGLAGGGWNAPITGDKAPYRGRS